MNNTFLDSLKRETNYTKTENSGQNAKIFSI